MPKRRGRRNPLIHSPSDKARSKNIELLMHEGYPRNRAVAAAYRNQREEQRRRGLPITPYRRKGRHLSRRNPAEASLPQAGAWLTGGALVGAGLGALTTTPRTTGALNGATTGVAIVAVGGIITAIFSKKYRDVGITAAGIGLGGLVLAGIISSLIPKPAGT